MARSDDAGPTLRLGTRGSLLARTQTEQVAAALRSANDGLRVEIRIIQTSGDRNQSTPFRDVGVKGMFVKEIEEALLDGSVDVGVHSLKDMPAELPEGLMLSAVPRREDSRDALVTRDGASLETLRTGALIATSSPRRQALLRSLRPDARVVELRGNLDTRLRKLDAGDYDAIILASAGLRRLGLAERAAQPLDPTRFVPAVGQGALALEVAANNPAAAALLESIADADSAREVAAERAFQAELGGGCSLPAGGWARVSGESLTMWTMLASPDGTTNLTEQGSAPVELGPELGRDLARRLLARGGSDILAALRTD